MRYFLFALFSLCLIVSINNNTAQAKAEKSDSAGEPSVHFVQLNPLILPFINDSGVTQTISLVVSLEVDSQDKVDKITRYSPRLVDAYLSDLYGSFSHQIPDSGIIPITYLKERLSLISNKVLGEEIVNDVLVQVLQSRRI